MDQTSAIVALVRQVLGDDVIGIYLHGSAVLGGLRSRSDIDVLTVSRRRMTTAQRRALVDGLLEQSVTWPREGDAFPIELTSVAQSDVRPWHYPPVMDFQYGEWLRKDFEAGELPARTPNPDLGPLITLVLLGDRPLAGPPPADVLDPVPHEDLILAVTAGIPSLLADLEDDTANVLLTLARIWATVATGSIHTKDGAADFALSRLPERHRRALARARSVYLDEAEDRWDDLADDLRPDAELLVREIERAVAATSRSGARRSSSRRTPRSGTATGRSD